MKITKNYLVPLLLPDFNPPKGSKGETALCLEIANYLREKTLCGNFPYIWFHVPNQFSGQYRGAFGATMAWMGKICGIPDYAFLGKGRCFFIEVKTPTGKLSENQEIVKMWCEEEQVEYYLCRSLQDVKKVLGEKKNI